MRSWVKFALMLMAVQVAAQTPLCPTEMPAKPAPGLEVMGGRMVSLGQMDCSEVVRARAVLFNPGPRPVKLAHGAAKGIGGIYLEGMEGGGDVIPAGGLGTILLVVDPKVFVDAHEVVVAVPTSAGPVPLKLMGSALRGVEPVGIPGAVVGEVSRATGRVAATNTSEVVFRCPPGAGKVTHWWISSPDAPVEAREASSSDSEWHGVLSLLPLQPVSPGVGLTRLHVQTASGLTGFVWVQWMVRPGK
jgi:hypothetical protein